MEKRLEQAKSFTKFIKGDLHIEYSIDKFGNKDYDNDITENMLMENLWCGVVARTKPLAKFAGAKVDSKTHTSEDMGPAKWVWVDIDSKKSETSLKDILERIRGIVEPSLVINSGHGYHCYWLLNSPSMEHDRLYKLMDRMTQQIEGADPARKNLNSMMRVPGSMNKKEGMEPVLVERISISKIRYSIEQLENLFPAIKPQQAKSEFFKKIESPYNGTVNNSLYAETLMLLEKGWTVETVYEQMEAKYKSLGEDHARFTSTFNSALNKFDIGNIKNPSIIRNNKIKSEIIHSLNSGNVEQAITKLGRLKENPIEVTFDNYSDGDEVQQQNVRTYNIGNSEFDSYSPFEAESVCLIAGLTGSGKTTVAINLVKAFSENNNCDILFLESDSETSSTDIKRLCQKIGLKNLMMSTFPRFEDMKSGFMNILNKYKETKGKYPDIVFIDTFEKMNASSENYALKLNTEVLSYMCQTTKCLFISLSQFSSTQYKTTKKASNYYPMSIQQGGMDVINNVNTWISMKRYTENIGMDGAHYNRFYFGKVRNSNSSVNLFDKYIQVPFNMEDFNLSFKNLELKDDVV